MDDCRGQRNELDELRNGAIMATAFNADGVTMTQRLGSWLPDWRSRAAIVLACVSLMPLRTVAAHLDAPPAFQDQAKEKSAAVRLDPGTPVEKELAGGATDTYEIQVGAGQFLHAVVNQMGIDVALTLYGPDGKQIATMASPRGGWGLEQISTIAEPNGVFRLEVVSDDKSAHAGHYRVSIEPLRVPTEAARARLSAERLFMEGLELSAVGNAASLRRALQKYEEALPLWRTASDVYEEATTVMSIGEVEFHLQENQKAFDSLTQVLALWRAAGDARGEAAALVDLGNLYDGRGEPEKALDSYNQALAVYRSVGDISGEGLALTGIGKVYRYQGREQDALKSYEQALEFERKAGDQAREATVLNNIGKVYEALGEERRAIEYFEQALRIHHAIGDRLDEAVNLNNLGLGYHYLGDEQKALEYLKEALPLRRETGDRAGEGRTLNNIGLVYDTLGEYEKGLDYYKQSLALYRAGGFRRDEGVALDNIGLVYRNLGDKEKALDYLNQALAADTASGDVSGQAHVLHNMSLVYADSGDFTKAIEKSEQALKIERAAGERATEAGTLDSLASLQKSLGHPEKALESYGEALQLARASESPVREAYILGDLMAYWRDIGRPAAAIFFGKQAVNKIQQMRANIRGFEKQTQQGFVKSRETTYRQLADLLIAQGRLPEAEEVLDLLKNEEYFEFIRRDSKESASLTAAAKLTTSEDAVHREYEENVERVTAIGNEYAALRAKPSRTVEEEQHLKELSERMTVANETWEKFLSDLYAELGKTKEAQQTVENVQESASGMQRVVRELGPGTVALYTFVGEEKYHVIVVTSTVTVARDYPVTAEELRKKVFEFRRVLMDPASDPLPKAQELYTILIGPIEKQLEGAKAVTLMWSLDGVLRYLPMAALHDGHRYLVEKYRNTVFTPASVPGLTGHLRVAAWQGLGMGVSKAYGGFLALPAVPDELHRIIHEAKDNRGEGVMPGRVMLDESFTPENMEKALQKNYPLVHIASHFDFSPGNETESFLLLGGNEEQGTRLTLAELRKNPAFSFSDTELLTLSACNTAVSGAAGDGREVDGIGFLAQLKGARAVVASLWGVNDQSTGVLMEQFYKLWTEHRNMPKAEALREAQLALLRGVRKSSGNPQSPRSSGTAANAVPHAEHAEYAHPFYWAPFILIGNWR
jgi:CHAT domain-containing protein/Tfp pilus assembly protein PilF